MAAMSIAEAWPAAGRPFTVADLDRMPDDGHRYELLDGALVVSPRPTNPHQEVAMELAVRLRSVCPRDLRVIPEPAVQLSATTEFAPDIAVIERAQINASKCTVPPLLIVEIRSPSTALIDLGRKKAAYEQFSVPAFWVVDPRVKKPSLTVFELADGHCQQSAQVNGDEPYRAEKPFPVEIIPSALVAGLLPDAADG
jgi:Uma2 family endonuclease